MEKIKNVVSLFDGISGARLALDRAGIKYENYYASEIDKYALQISRRNYPDNIQLGAVQDIDIINLPKIDLLIGGSPCTDISVAGTQKGIEADTLDFYLKLKEEGFEFGGQSYLFWEYVRIRNILIERNPDLIWILENVTSMGSHFKKKFDSALYFGGYRFRSYTINSALVSAQNRLRTYWTNIDRVDQPEDKYIYLKDILESGNSDKLKSYCIDASYYKGSNLEMYLKKKRRQLVFDKPKKIFTLYANDSQAGRVYSEDGKSVTLNSEGGGGGAKTGLYAVKSCALRSRDSGKELEVNKSDKSNALTTAQTDSLVIEPTMFTEARTEEAKKIRKENMKRGKDWCPRRAKELQPRPDGKGNCLTTGLTKEHILLDQDFFVRKLLPCECERLQTYPVNWTAEGVNEEGAMVTISDTNRYKTIGNSFTVDVIAHILKHIDPNYDRKTNYLF